MVLACISLVVSLGGVSYAAGVLPKNSVGSSQLKKGAVRPSKLSPATLALFKGSAGGAGAKGDRGPKGERGPKGDSGAKGATGATGATGPFTQELPSGKTIRGEFQAYGTGTGAGMPARDAISFDFALKAAPLYRVIKQGAPATLACPGYWGDPQAAPGYLCIYEDVNVAAEPIHVIAIRPFGAIVQTTSTDKGLFGSNGSWAVTAPY
jgi:hypothetical protein